MPRGGTCCREPGWQVIVFTANDLRRPWLMANLVKRTLRERGER